MDADKFVDYNSFNQIDLLAYNCIVKLLETENIWKLIHPDYMTPDCLNKTNLTKTQKRSIIYKGQEDSSPFRVFTDGANNNDAMPERAAILKIYPALIIPNNYVISTTSVVFECLCHYKVNTLDNYASRSLSMVKEILQSLNGENIGGIGVLVADRRVSTNNKIQFGTYSDKGYSGYALTMSTQTT